MSITDLVSEVELYSEIEMGAVLGVGAFQLDRALQIVPEFHGNRDRLWQPNEHRQNELVVIGRNFDAAKLRADFLA